MNELGVSKTISDEQFAQACRALGISADFTRDLDVLLHEPELKMEMLTWMIQSGEGILRRSAPVGQTAFES